MGLLSLDVAITLSIIFLFIIVMAVKIRVNHKATLSWLIVFFFIIALLFRLPTIAAPFNHRVGMALSPLLVGMSFLSAIFFGCLAHYKAVQRRIPRLLPTTYFVTLALLGVIFKREVTASTPLESDYSFYESIFPGNGWHVLSGSVFYVYASTLFVVMLQIVIPLLRSEQILTNKIRWLVTFITYLSCIFILMGKNLLITLGFMLEPPHPIRELVIFPILCGQVIVGTGFAMMLLPEAFYRVLVRPFLFSRKLLTLRNLACLNRALHALPIKRVPFAFPGGMGLRLCLQEPDLCIYQFLQDILDHKVVLAVSPLKDNSWVKELIQVDDSLAYEKLVQTYAELGEKMRKRDITR